MSDGNGSKDLGPWIVAGAILSIAVLCFWIAFSISQIGYSVSQEQATSRAYSEAKKEFEDKCTIKTTIEEVISCFNDAIESGREPGRSEEDVNAQKQMADAAWAMLQATLFIGLLGIGLTFLGIRYIRKTPEFRMWHKDDFRIGADPVTHMQIVVAKDFTFETEGNKAT